MTRKPPKGAPTLEAIVIAPRNVVLAIGESQQFTATGHWSHGYVQDISESVTWSSSDEGVATVDDTGFAVAQGVGTAVITAALGGVSMGASFFVNGESNDDLWFFVVPE